MGILARCFFLVPALTAAETGDLPRMTVTLSAPPQGYLLGEPTLLDVTACNETQGPIEADRAVSTDLRIEIAPDGGGFRETSLTGTVGKVHRRRESLKPGEKWVISINLLTCYEVGVGDTLPLALPRPGGYSIRVRYPQIRGAENHQITTEPVHVDIRAPQGDDRQVLDAIEGNRARAFLADWRAEGGDDLTARKLAKLLKDHPDTGYREALRHNLTEYYRFAKTGLKPDDREMQRVLLGEPDDRFFPDDARLDAKVVLDFPRATHISVVFESLRRQAGVSLAASPFIMLERYKVSSFHDQKMTLREALLKYGGPPELGCARRGDGYYLYLETLEKPEGRKVLRDLLGPVDILFPADKRLTAQVVADCPEPTPIDRVLAAYARQSGVELSASPFLSRCVQAGGRQDFDLREEMAYLARTFRAKWERRGEGYYLDAGREADAAPDHPRPEPKKASTTATSATTAGLGALGLAVGLYAFHRALGSRRRSGRLMAQLID